MNVWVSNWALMIMVSIIGGQVIAINVLLIALMVEAKGVLRDYARKYLWKR